MSIFIFLGNVEIALKIPDIANLFLSTASQPTKRRSVQIKGIKTRGYGSRGNFTLD